MCNRIYTRRLSLLFYLFYGGNNEKTFLIIPLALVVSNSVHASQIILGIPARVQVPVTLLTWTMQLPL